MKFYLISLLFLSSCITTQTVVSQERFDRVELGASQENVLDILGKPYSIKQKGPNTFEYLYIERIMMGSEVIEQRRYIIIFKEGAVVSKREQRANLPAYQEINEDDPNQTEY